MAGKNPKTIATINFKGGVGKTTVTWCLADVVSIQAKLLKAWIPERVGVKRAFKAANPKTPA